MTPACGIHQHSVLIVDDSTDTRESLALLLEVEGFRVVTAPGGLEALHVLLTLGVRPCAVIVDLIMPAMDGFTFSTEMRKHAQIAATPLIALTGHEGLRRQAVDLGFVGALLKPCDVSQLFELIVRHCPAATSPHAKLG